MNAKQTEISPCLFKEMVIAAYQLLDAEKDYINSLNVFPVPDGVCIYTNDISNVLL